MVRPPLVCTVLLAGLTLFPSPARADQEWPVAKGPSHEPLPYRYDPAVLAKVPRAFLDDSVAVTLYSGNSHRIEKDGAIETTTHEITRLNGRKGVDKLGEYRNITYTPAHQKLTLHEARIHKAGGKIIDVEPRHVHLRDVSTDFQVYDPEKQLIISFPSLEVGDTIEVKWTIRGKNPEHADQLFTRYSFGDPNYPVVLDEFRVILPKDKILKYTSVYGKVEPAITEKGGQKLFLWRKINNDKQPRDDDLPSKEELRPAVLVSTFTTWAEVGAWKANLRANCWKCTPDVETLVKKLTAGLKTQAEKARALTYWVRRNVRYVSVGDKHDYTPHLPAKVLANRYGDCKDTSQLLAVMLSAVGVKVELATLGALDDGQVNKDVPSPWGTHAILCATIDGKEHWIDTTAQLAGWDFLPRDDRDRVCYLTDDKGKVRLGRTPKIKPERNRIEQTTEVWIGADGTSRCRRTVVSSGSAALTQRDNYVEVPPGERRRQATSELQDSHSRTRLLNLDVDEKTLHDHDQPVTVRMEYEIPRHFVHSADHPNDREGSFTDNKVWSKLLSHNIDHERKTPLVLPSPCETIHTYRFHLPIGYELDGLPSDKTHHCEWATFTVRSRSLDREKSHRNVEVVFHLRLENPRIEVAGLEAFRKFRDAVDRDYRVWLTLTPVTSVASAQLMEELLAVSPQNGFAATTLARIYLRAKKLADARRVLERACYYTPDEKTLWELRVQASETDREKARAQRALVKRFPESRFKLALATTLVTLDKHNEARDLLNRLTERGSPPSRADAHFQLARSHYRKDELKDALKELDEAQQEDAETVNNVRAWTLRGQVLEELKRPAAAMNAYAKVLALESRNQNALLVLIRLALETGDKPATLDYLRRYSLAAGKDVSGLLLAAETYFKLKRYDDAFELASRARDMAFHEKAQRILGLVYLMRGDDAKALKHLDRADTTPVVLAGLIRASINLGKVGELESYLQKSARMDKPSEGLKRACESARSLLQRRKELGKLVSVPAGKEAEYAAALDALVCAEADHRANRPASKVEALLARACKPGLAIGPALALRGKLALARGKLTAALADANRAIDLCPRDSLGFLVRGKVRLERATPEALADLEKAAELSGRKDADVLQALAEALAGAGRYDDAVAAQKAAVKLRPADSELTDQLAALEKAAREKGGGR